MRGLSEFNINLSCEETASRPVALILPIGEGFINHSAKFVLIGYHDVFIKSRGAG